MMGLLAEGCKLVVLNLCDKEPETYRQRLWKFCTKKGNISLLPIFKLRGDSKVRETWEDLGCWK